MSIWGTPVVLGGGGRVPLLTSAEWNALSTAQKQTYGLVAVQDSNSDFDRGQLYYGADYTPIGIYIPNSDDTHIICEAMVSNFVNGTYSWGNGKNPIQFTKALATYSTQEEAIYIPVKSSDARASVDLEANDIPYTVYMVAKTVNCTGYNRVLSTFKAHSSGNGVMFYGNPMCLSSWADNVQSSGINPNNDYFVCVLMWESAQNNGGQVNDGNWMTRPAASQSGRHVTIARTDIDEGANQEPTDIYVKYFAVVKHAETNDIIQKNINYLMTQFNI